jgi:hypothetical protein
MAPTMARVVVVAVLLVQCCNLILAARPLLRAAADAGDGSGWQLMGHAGGGGALVMQALNGPGNHCRDYTGPEHPPCGPPSS